MLPLHVRRVDAAQHQLAAVGGIGVPAAMESTQVHTPRHGVPHHATKAAAACAPGNCQCQAGSLRAPVQPEAEDRLVQQPLLHHVRERRRGVVHADLGPAHALQGEAQQQGRTKARLCSAACLPKRHGTHQDAVELGRHKRQARLIHGLGKRLVLHLQGRGEGPMGAGR